MQTTKHKKRVKTDDLKNAIRIRKKQIAFDSYPEELRNFLTRIGMNPYDADYENRIEHRTANIGVKE